MSVDSYLISTECPDKTQSLAAVFAEKGWNPWLNKSTQEIKVIATPRCSEDSIYKQTEAVCGPVPATVVLLDRQGEEEDRVVLGRNNFSFCPRVG